MKKLASVLVLGLLPVLATPAAAHIACDDEFQIVAGHEIATPYCGDRALARAARQDGKMVRGRDLRANPGLKAEVCRFVGKNPSVSSDCADSED